MEDALEEETPAIARRVPRRERDRTHFPELGNNQTTVDTPMLLTEVPPVQMYFSTTQIFIIGKFFAIEKGSTETLATSRFHRLYPCKTTKKWLKAAR